MAETDRNRTCQTEMLGLTGFEDRGAHQDTYASVWLLYRSRAHPTAAAPPLSGG